MMIGRYSGGDYEANGANVSIYFALIAIGGGLGLITSYRIEKKELLDKEDKVINPVCAGPECRAGSSRMR
jgi:hypothetical protein